MRRGQYQHALHHTAQHILLQYHPRFHSLPQAYLVRQQDPATELLQHLAHRLHLEPVGIHAVQLRQAQQFVEALQEVQMREFPAQVKPAAGICV